MATTIASTDVGGTGLSTVGTNGQVLTSNGTTLSWVTPSVTTVTGTLPVANGGTGLTSFTAGQIHFGSFSQSANLFWDNTNARLGVGTSSPTLALDVINLTGGVTAQFTSPASSGVGIYLNNSLATPYKWSILNGNVASNIFSIKDETAAVTRLVIDTSGNTGIGETSPASYGKLTITGSSASGGINAWVRNTSDASADNVKYAGIQFSVGSDNGSTAIRSYRTNSGTDYSSAMAFLTRGSGTPATSPAERMRIGSNGFVGIATASPTTYLDINPDNITYSYSGNLRVGKTSTGPGQSLVDFEQTASLSSEDFNLNAQSTSYTNNSVQGWAQYRIMNNTARTTVYNHTCMVANGGSQINYYFRGDGNAYAHATWNSNGVDYAEYFESVDGNEIPVGTTVVLENGKIRTAVNTDLPTTILGIVRPKINAKGPSLVGGGNTTEWKDRYLTNDYGQYVMEPYSTYEWDEEITDADGNVSTKHHDYVSDAIPEGITVPPNTPLKTEQADGTPLIRQKLNPDYDQSHTYVSREIRSEWHIIGLLGQIPMTKGQPVGDRWIKLNDISKTVEMWFVK